MSESFVFDDANEMFLAALTLCFDGQRVAPRGQPCSEQRYVSLMLLNPDRNIVTFPARKLSYHFMVAEWLWVLGGMNDVATIAAYNKNIAQFSDDGKTFFGAYGPRFIRDFAKVAALLRKDPDTRQAIINIWNPEALRVETKDVPCTLTWQFFIRRGLLEMHACMRSNDVWLGFPYDLFNFTQIQRYLAAWLGVGVGTYVHTVGSMHLYDRNRDSAAELLNQDDLITPVSPPLTFPSPAVVTGMMQGLAGVIPDCSLEWAREATALVTGGWLEYLGVLIHKFSKDRADLGPFFQELIK